MRTGNIDKLLLVLKESPPLKNIFNPWAEVDRENDINSRTPEIRTNQLKHYLDVRRNKIRYILVGEALGYQGGHFSGIPMTSERILLGYKKDEGIFPSHVLLDIEPERTSKPEVMPKGFSEPTATIVWGTLLGIGVEPKDFVLWNVFPWHPFNPQKGILSNRRPLKEELKYGYSVLKIFLEIFPGKKNVALGKIAADALNYLGMPYHKVRHPANAGARDFKAGIKRLF